MRLLTVCDADDEEEDNDDDDTEPPRKKCRRPDVPDDDDDGENLPSLQVFIGRQHEMHAECDIVLRSLSV